MATSATPPLNEAKLHDFVMKAVGEEVGAAMNAALVGRLIGDRLGLYKGLAGSRTDAFRRTWRRTGPWTHDALRPRSGWRRKRPADSSLTTRPARLTRCRRNKRWPWRMRIARSFYPGFYRDRGSFGERRAARSPMPFAPARAWAGTSMTLACLPEPSGSSVPTTALI